VVQAIPTPCGKVGELEVGQKAKGEGEAGYEACLRRPVDRSLSETAGEASCCAEVHGRVAEEESAVVEVLVLEVEIAVKEVISSML
jgi:hypothetical protein